MYRVSTIIEYDLKRNNRIIRSIILSILLSIKLQLQQNLELVRIFRKFLISNSSFNIIFHVRVRKKNDRSIVVNFKEEEKENHTNKNHFVENIGGGAVCRPR